MMNRFQEIVNSVRVLGEEGRKLAEEFDSLNYEELLQVIIDDTDIDEALAALDGMVGKDGDSLMTILKRWAVNNPDRKAIDEQVAEQDVERKYDCLTIDKVLRCLIEESDIEQAAQALDLIARETGSTVELRWL